MSDFNFGLFLIGIIVLVGGVCTNSIPLFLFGIGTSLFASYNEIENS